MNSTKRFYLLLLVGYSFLATAGLASAQSTMIDFGEAVLGDVEVLSDGTVLIARSFIGDSGFQESELISVSRAGQELNRLQVGTLGTGVFVSDISSNGLWITGDTHRGTGPLAFRASTSNPGTIEFYDPPPASNGWHAGIEGRSITDNGTVFATEVATPLNTLYDGLSWSPKQGATYFNPSRDDHVYTANSDGSVVFGGFRNVSSSFLIRDGGQQIDMQHTVSDSLGNDVGLFHFVKRSNNSGTLIPVQSEWFDLGTFNSESGLGYFIEETDPNQMINGSGFRHEFALDENGNRIAGWFTEATDNQFLGGNFWDGHPSYENDAVIFSLSHDDFLNSDGETYSPRMLEEWLLTEHGIESPYERIFRIDSLDWDEQFDRLLITAQAWTHESTFTSVYFNVPLSTSIPEPTGIIALVACVVGISTRRRTRLPEA